MTKRKELQLNEAPVDLSEEKETKKQRLARLRSYVDQELLSDNPSYIYLEELNLSIGRLV